MKKIILLLISFLLIIVRAQSQNLHLFKLNELWGYKNDKDSIVIYPQYSYAEKFILNYAIVDKNNFSGVIDQNNNIIIPFKYHVINRIDTADFSFGFRKNTLENIFMELSLIKIK